MKTTLASTLLIALVAIFAIGTARKAERPSDQSKSFTALGDLPGGNFCSVANGVSADGSVVVGYSFSEAGSEAFRWTPRGGMKGLGFPEASAVSADGSTVVGFRYVGNAAEPVRWTQRGGLHGLGNISGYIYGDAFGASTDGSVIVGRCEPRSGLGEMAFRWTQARGCAPLEHLPAGVDRVEAHGVSADGEVIVGEVWYRSHRTAAFRWNSKEFIELGTLPGDTCSRACAVSSDGSVVVGSSGHMDVEAFRWTRETGIVGLGMLPGGSRNSAAFAVSEDGSTIVGQSHSKFGLEAFVWDAAHGMRGIRQLLLSESDLDTSLRGWRLRLATGVSRDGTVIVGSGINPDGNREAWIARVSDEPLTEARALRVAVR